MAFPLDLVHTHPQAAMVAAVAVGFGFGFVLERAGFGRSTKLAAQFYLHDMTVFKVMFGAIVTAMLGLVVLSGFGVVDLRAISESAASFTYLWPMIGGGLLLGVGFIVSGYCPGTSVVATASGNLDGLVAFVGVVIGSLLYSELQPLVAGFHSSGDLGWVFLYDLLGIPYQVLALAVVVMAVVAFVGAEKVEAIFTQRRTGEAPVSPALPKRLAFAGFAAVAVLAVATLAIQAGPAEASAPRVPVLLEPEDLAERLFDEPWTMRLLDTREGCAEARVPGSSCVTAEGMSELGLEWAPSEQDLVVVGDGSVPEAALAYPGEVLAVDFASWKAWALTEPAAPPPGADEATRAQWQRRVGIWSALTGVKQPPAPTSAPTIQFTPKKRKDGGGCG